MAGITAAIPGSTPSAKQTLKGALFLMLLLYFGIGFITTMNDVLIAHFKDLFHLTNAKSLLVQFAFFGAYFVFSAPAGWVVQRLGYKLGIVTALLVIAAGLGLFYPASIVIAYPIFLGALFVIGCGLAILQVAANPFVGTLGPERTAAARLNLCGFCNSLAGTLAPFVGALFIFADRALSQAQLAQSVRAPYMILAGLAVALSIAAYFAPLPNIEEHTGTAIREGHAIRFLRVRLGMVAIFLYVGVEVAIGSLLITYLALPQMGAMSHKQAAQYVSFYWGAAMVGRLIGFFVQQKVRQETALLAVTAAAVLCMSLAIAAPGSVSLYGLVLCGLFNSVMWPCIFPMTLSKLGAYTTQASSLLVAMIVGGALIPLLQAFLADHFGFRRSFVLLLGCYLYLLFFALRYRAGDREEPLQPSLANEPGIAL